MADLRIPYALPDLRPGAEFLLGAMNQKAARDTADRQAATQEEYARLGYAKLSATAERERQKHEQEGQDRLIKATSAAEALEDAGDTHGADRLRRLHGIQTKPIMGAPTQLPPTVITPQQALGTPPESKAGQTSPATSYRGPSVSPDNRGSMTPVQALAPQPPAVSPEDSVENQMPLTIPGDVEQGQVMPGSQLVGPRGEDLGINDPSVRLAARQARAERIRGALSPVSPELAAIVGVDIEEEMGKDFSPVVKAYTAGRAEQGREGRSIRAEGGRNSRQEDQQAFIGGENSVYKDTPADRDRRAQWMANSRIEASGTPNKVDIWATRALQAQAESLRRDTAHAKLVASDKTTRDIMMNIKSGAVNLQLRDAQVSLGKYFRGGVPTGWEMKHLYDNLGGTADAWNRFRSHLVKGALSPEEKRQLKASAKAVAHEHGENVRRFATSGRAKLGPGSGFDNMPDQAQAHFDSMAAELGIEPGSLPRLYDTRGGITIGSGKGAKVKVDDVDSRISDLEGVVHGGSQ